MPVFGYRAVGPGGRHESGSLTATSEALALQALRDRGLIPLGLEPRGAGAGPALGRSAAPLRSRGRRTVSRDDVQRFTSELNVLLRAGMPLDRAMRIQVEMSEPGPYQALLEEAIEGLRSGRSLSAVLQQHPLIFSDFYISLVRSGEAGGRLAEVLRDLADYLESTRQVRASVTSALMYPSILLVVALLSIAVMLGFVVPQFQSLFDDMGEGLPVLTTMVIGLGDFVRNYGLLMLMFLVAFALGFGRWLRHGQGRLWKDRTMLRLPVLGDVLLKFEMARFARTFATLYESGVSLLGTIEIAVETVGNSAVRAAFEELPSEVKGGRTIAQSLSGNPIFSPLMLQMVRVGEESGDLASMMMEVARIYEDEVNTGIKRALTLLEPLLILGMGAVIAVIIMAILMGILSVNELAL